MRPSRYVPGHSLAGRLRKQRRGQEHGEQTVTEKDIRTWDSALVSFYTGKAVRKRPDRQKMRAVRGAKGKAAEKKRRAGSLGAGKVKREEYRQLRGLGR